MQLHEHAGAAPALAALAHNKGGKHMQFDAIAHATLKNGKKAEKLHKKTGIQGAGLCRYLRGGLLAAQCANNAF
jgi:hypothetical protein